MPGDEGHAAGLWCLASFVNHSCRQEMLMVTIFVKAVQCCNVKNKLCKPLNEQTQFVYSLLNIFSWGDIMAILFP